MGNGHDACSQHNRYGALAALLGQGMARQRIRDGMRAIDYLLSRDDMMKGGVEDPKHGRGTKHFDAGFAKYGKPGDALQRRIELYLLDCGVTEEEIATFRSIMLESP